MVDIDKFRKLGEAIRIIVRALNGQDITEESFSGLLNVKDIRERTKLNTRQIYQIAYLLTLADKGGKEWKICKDIATMQMHLLISKNGEQWTQAIDMEKARKSVNIAPIGIPPQQQQEKTSKKRGLLDRLRGKTND